MSSRIRNAPDFLWSEYHNYLVDVNNNNLLYVHVDLPVSKVLKIVRKNVEVYGNLYNVYSFSKKFRNDCLLFAECLVTNSFKYHTDACFLKEKKTGKAFGNSDEENVQIAKEVSIDYYYDNYSVNPDIGEAYAIASHNIKEGRMPYHIAYVLAKDGISNITIEADAGDALSEPKFGIYDVQFPEIISSRRGRSTVKKEITNKTFHESYKKYFQKSSTFVLTENKDPF